MIYTIKRRESDFTHDLWDYSMYNKTYTLYNVSYILPLEIEQAIMIAEKCEKFPLVRGVSAEGVHTCGSMALYM